MREFDGGMTNNDAAASSDALAWQAAFCHAALQRSAA
jgi:hypothetical protein